MRTERTRTASVIIGLTRAAWRYRFYILSTIATEFRARVARSRLGMLWVIIAPLAQIATYALVLSAVMSQRLPGIDNRFSYAIYLIAGFAAWFLFAEIVNRAVTVFIDNGNALKKIAFPRIVLPVTVVGSAVISNLVFSVIALAAFLALGHNPGWALLYYPLLLVITAALGIGLGLVLGVLNVFIRDVGQIVAILLQFGFWLTPIVYMAEIIPEAYRGILLVNPMYWVVDSYHRVLVYGLAPDPLVLAGLAVLALALCALALVLFRRANGEMVDML